MTALSLKQFAEAFFGAVKNQEGKWTTDAEGKESVRFDLQPPLKSQALERFSMDQAYYGQPERRCVTSETPWCENCHKHGHSAEAGRYLTQAETKEEMIYREHRLKNNLGLPEDEHTEIAAWAHFESEYDQIIFAEITMSDNLGYVKEMGDAALLPHQKKASHAEVQGGRDTKNDNRRLGRGHHRRAVDEDRAERDDEETHRCRGNAQTTGRSAMEIDLRGQEEEPGPKQQGEQLQNLGENRKAKSKQMEDKKAEDSPRPKTEGMSDMEVDIRGQEEKIGPKQQGVQQPNSDENHEVNGKQTKERRAEHPNTAQRLMIGRGNRSGSADGDKSQQRLAGWRTQGGWLHECSGSAQEARRSEEDPLWTSAKQMGEKGKVEGGDDPGHSQILQGLNDLRLGKPHPSTLILPKNQTQLEHEARQEIESLWNASIEEPQISLAGKKRSRAQKKMRVALSGALAQETSASEAENLKRQRLLLRTPMDQPHTLTAMKTQEQQTNVGPEEQADPEPDTTWANPLVLSSSASLSLHPLNEMELTEFQRVEEEENPGPIQQAEENHAFNDIHVQRMLVLDGRFDELRQQDRLRIVPLVLRIWEAKLQLLLCQLQKETRLPTIPFLKFAGHHSIQKAIAMVEKWLGPDCDVLPMKGVSAIRLLLRSETGESLGAYCFMLRAESQKHVDRLVAPRLEWADLEPLTVDLPNMDGTSTTHEETIDILALLKKRLLENKRFTHASFITDPETWLRGPRQGGKQSSRAICYGNTRVSRLRAPWKMVTLQTMADSIRLDPADVEMALLQPQLLKNLKRGALWTPTQSHWSKLDPLQLQSPETVDQILQQPIFDNPAICDQTGVGESLRCGMDRTAAQVNPGTGRQDTGGLGATSNRLGGEAGRFSEDLLPLPTTDAAGAARP
ncbi:hypothetical protein CBR_g32680 [Chara braunii]|uniref:Uncharacterized protein n=1 Tax=Chara braunii TaxID=69332 RepID=A0A388LHG0_CHABU|nr:hypothetical protein CBR_g32680 [Chara braunii]|eukprot:GBG81685.1 hypothetical protein CBR_g32680 [Chara braunii]